MGDQEDLLALEQGEMGNVAVLRPRLIYDAGRFFVSARQWFGPAKAQGLAMLKVARKKADDETAKRIASDLAIIAKGVHGWADGAFVTCSGDPFEAKVGLTLAGMIGATAIDLFEDGIIDVKKLPRERRTLFLAIDAENLEAHVRALEAQNVKHSLIVWVHGSTRGGVN